MLDGMEINLNEQYTELIFFGRSVLLWVCQFQFRSGTKKKKTAEQDQIEGKVFYRNYNLKAWSLERTEQVKKIKFNWKLRQ